MKPFTLLVFTVFLFVGCSAKKSGSIFKVSFTQEVSNGPQDGRILLLLAASDKVEPRFQMSHGLGAQLIYGLDVNGMKPGEELEVSDEAFGYPIQSIHNIPKGEYYVQALINRYETYHLNNGKTVKLPPDMGEGQQWNQKPGNLYSRPFKIRIDPTKPEEYKIVIDQKIPPIDPPADTRYVKHIKIESKLLSEWWGKPTFLGAHILLPEGFDEHPEARYPLMIYQGHFPVDF